jgi:cbb3-type cytochrome oxidase maturation protein
LGEVDNNWSLTVEILFVLVPISLILIAVAIWFFIWAVNSDQFEDLDRQGYEILFDQDESELDEEEP